MTDCRVTSIKKEGRKGLLSGRDKRKGFAPGLEVGIRGSCVRTGCVLSGGGGGT